MSNIKEFKDEKGNLLAHAAIPDSYTIGGSLVNKLHHEAVPFFITTHAIDAGRNIMIFGLSDEMFSTYKNQMLKSTLKMVPGTIWDSIRDFIEPEEYLKEFASAMSQMDLKEVATAKLPSIIGQNIQAAYDNMIAFYNNAFEIEASLGTPVKSNNSICNSFMVKYDGKAKSGADCVVIAGMDYKGIEYYTTISMAAALNPLFGLFGGSREKEKGGSKQFGHGKPCDVIDWGAANKFIVIAPKQYEEEATKDFLGFVATFNMDQNLRNQFYQGISNRKQQTVQTSMQMAQMANASAQRLMQSQQQLTQTLAQNSAAMSNMIMDSWDKKMASDSRISQARSEAILGVNTYQNSYGQNVQVDVSADHVYQNQYGDVYGVSGNGPDQELLNKLNWTELTKK